MLFDFSDIQFKRPSGKEDPECTASEVADGFYDTGRSAATLWISNKIYEGVPFDINEKQVSDILAFLNDELACRWLAKVKFPVIDYLTKLLNDNK